jgi:hypothetical protein
MLVDDPSDHNKRRKGSNMAKGRIRSRMELREQYDAAEARKRDGGEDQSAEAEDEDLGEMNDDQGEEGEKAPALKKKKKKPASEAKPRKKAIKAAPRQHVVWIVYDNSNKAVQNGRFAYKDKAKADELAEKLKTDKKMTYFVQPVKEPMPEQK